MRRAELLAQYREIWKRRRELGKKYRLPLTQTKHLSLEVLDQLDRCESEAARRIILRARIGKALGATSLHKGDR